MNFVLINILYFDYQVLPTVVKLFASTDRAIRVGLLQHIDSFGAGLSTQVVDEQVCKYTGPVILLASFEESQTWVLSIFVLSLTCVSVDADLSSHSDRFCRYICFSSRAYLEVNAITCSKGKYVDCM